MSRPVDFLSPISVIPGFGEKRVEALRESGIYRAEDLLYYLPRRYLNKTEFVPIANLAEKEGESCMVSGEITAVRVERGKRSRLRVALRDDSGTMELLWFSGLGYLRKILTTGRKITVLGKPKRFVKFQMVHPEIDFPDQQGESFSFEPRYSLTQKMRDAKVGQKRLRDAISWLFKNIRHFPRKIPEELEARYRFPDLNEVLYHLHFPNNPDENDTWVERLIYEELYQTALNLRWTGREFKLPGRVMESHTLQDNFIQSLPFELTEGQREVIELMKAESASKKRMHRLLQGDVGSGKTVTAFITSLPALESGFQVGWLAPTAVLADQIYDNIKNWLAPFDYGVELLTGATSAAKKREILHGLKTGTIHYVVGTHALIQDRVGFHNLGFVVVDEQHRFGVKQRLALQKKGESCDTLMMSATPIPNSLASTIYSDLELTTIKSMPKGRIPIKSHLVPETKRSDMEQFVLERIEKHNEKVFWIVPRIESVEDDFNELTDIENRLKQLTKGTFKKVKVSVLHGQMSAAEKEDAMTEFAGSKSSLLLATTVVEVGVNIPEATVIVIENSERFGLAQLHQLRGRVGRSNLQSWAFFLMANSVAEESVDRVSRFIEAKDGFEIAELDLSLRGTGEIAGFKQSGFSELRFSNIIEQADLFREIQADIDKIMSRET